jgi:acyl-CoA thioester hydrolase
MINFDIEKAYKVYYRIIYGDTDAMGVVYYSNYLRIFEMARSEFMRNKGLPYSEVEKKGFAMPVTEAYCKYINSASYDELVEILMVISPVSRTRVRFDYHMINSETMSLCEGYTVHACIDMKTRRPLRLPDFLEKIIQ